MPPVPIEYANDFESYALGALVDPDWSWITGGNLGGTLEVVNDTGTYKAAGNAALHGKTVTPGRHIARYDAATGTTRNMRLVTRVWTGTSAFNRRFGVAGRLGIAGINDNTSSIEGCLYQTELPGWPPGRVELGAGIYHYDQPTQVLTTLVSAAYEWSTDTIYHIDLVVVDDAATLVVRDATNTADLVTLAANGVPVGQGGRAGIVIESANNVTNNVAHHDVWFTLDYDPSEEETLPPTAPVVGVPTDRYRLSLSTDSRSLLASARAVPFDASSTINLPAAVGLLPQQTLYPIRELTRAATGSVHDSAFFPRATQNQNHERQYDGVTILTRMRASFPARLANTVENLALASNRASTIITYVLTAWATEFPWFTFETVPDLRTAVPGGTGLLLPSEYDTGVDEPRLGVVRSDAIVFPQDPDRERLSMYDMLEALLSPFPGTVFFANAAGKLQIVPVYGPDADENPYKTLGTDDVASISLGEPSVADIINRAVVSSRGYTLSDNVALMQPAWFQYGSRNLYGVENVWYAPPNDRLNLQKTDTDGEVLQETLAPSDRENLQSWMVWPISSTSIPAGNGISLVDDLDAPQITVGWTVYKTGGLDVNVVESTGTSGLALLENVVPFDGVARNTFRLLVGTPGGTLNIVFSARWDAAQNAVIVHAATSATSATGFAGSFFIQYDLVAEFTLDDASAGVVETTGVTVTYDASTDVIPGTNGVNAIQESVDAYGVLEERVDVRGYVLTSAQALDMARGIVLANLSPRAVRELDLGVRGSTVPLFDDRGRRFGFPDGGEGLLVGVAYQDDFVNRAWSKRVRIEEIIPGAAGYIPTSTVWLLNDDNSYWLNEDGELSQPA